MKKDNVTIKEIAEKSGVSISTVSRVINQYKNISDEVRARVLAVIEETGFVPNSSAVSMVKKRTHLLVVIVPHIMNPFFTTLIHVIEEEVKKEGYYTIVFSTNDSEEAEKEFLTGAIGNTVDGILTVSSIRDVRFLNNHKKKMVLLDRAVPNCTLDSVTFDHFHALYDAVGYLVSMGHEKIAFITGTQGTGIAEERLNGYRQALKDAQIKEIPGYVIRRDWYAKSGYEATLELIRSDDPPTAILAGNNMICEGVMQALSESGLAWGRDISLIGFEESETDLFAKAGVTVVKLDAFKLGRTACSILLDALNQKDTEGSYGRKLIRSSMIYRKSVKNLKE